MGSVFRFGGSRGFTLMELLVVMAIISILAALILPAVADARSRARVVQCKNNLRSIGVSIQLYASSFDDWMPIDGDCMDPSAGRTGTDLTWDSVNAYGDETRGHLCGLGILTVLNNKFLGDPAVLFCPADDGLNADAELGVLKTRQLSPAAFGRCSYIYRQLDARGIGDERKGRLGRLGKNPGADMRTHINRGGNTNNNQGDDNNQSDDGNNNDSGDDNNHEIGDDASAPGNSKKAGNNGADKGSNGGSGNGGNSDGNGNGGENGNAGGNGGGNGNGGDNGNQGQGRPETSVPQETYEVRVIVADRNYVGYRGGEVTSTAVRQNHDGSSVNLLFEDGHVETVRNGFPGTEHDLRLIMTGKKTPWGDSGDFEDEMVRCWMLYDAN